MKLDFKSNASGISTVEEEFCNDIYEDSRAKASAQLQAGIKAAQEGSRAEAKHLLLRVTETEPGNEEDSPFILFGTLLAIGFVWSFKSACLPF